MIDFVIVPTEFKAIDIEQTVEDAIEMLTNTDENFIPVVENNICRGVVSLDMLDGIKNKQEKISQFSYAISPLYIKHDSHIIFCLPIFSSSDVDVIPVVNEEQEYLGVVFKNEVFEYFKTFIGWQAKAGIVVMEIPAYDFSASALSRHIELANAKLMQLNTKFLSDRNSFLVTCQIDKENIDETIANLQRYDYQILYHYGEESFENKLQSNYENLISYLNV